MSQRFEGKVVLVTGGASGIGLAVARRVVAEAGRVVLVDLDAEGVERAQSELGPQASGLVFDVSDEQGWRDAMASVESRHGRLDALINNAGVLAEGSIEETDLATWQSLMRINADSVFLGCHHALPLLKRQGGGIVNLSSIAAIGGKEDYAAYSATKGAVAALTRSIATHCRRQRYRVRCNSVHPDGVMTPMTAATYPAGVEPADYTIRQDPMHRLCLPEDVASGILFLASDDAQAINGIELRIDSGQFVMSI
ncbi:MAG TPA: SDR family oxidoreductase [Pseudomonas sp.]|nr:SDR family oxidoreductase [Pseudomonas sp.]